MSETSYAVTLTLCGPVLTQGAAASIPGIDAPMAVTSGGMYCLPWSLVRGRMRQSLEELGAAMPDQLTLDPDDCFGSEPDKSAAFEKSGAVTPNRGRITIGDFVSSIPANGRVRHRIAVEAGTGAVKKGALMVMESPFATGDSITFSGKVRVHLPPGTDAESMRRYLESIFRWTTALGGQRTIGFGRVLSAKVATDTAAKSAPQGVGINAKHTRLVLTLKPEAPFCFAWNKTSGDNLFQSRPIIPGAAIKGAVAERWRRLAGKNPRVPVASFGDGKRSQLAAHFDGLVFRDALPSALGKPRAKVPPLSLVRTRTIPTDTPFYDVALCAGPRLIGGDAPAFAVDWKFEDSATVHNEFGLASPRTITRLRNAMDRTTLRTEDEKLFAQELIVPDSCGWIAEVDASHITDVTVRAAVLTQLAELMGLGLAGLGKTKVWAETTAVPAEPRVLGDSPGGGMHVVTLQTAALLADPFTIPGPASVAQMHAAYAADWSQLSDGSLTLVRHFARQSLAGGYYLHSAFRKGNPYNPWLLTEAGAVFVLQTTQGREADSVAFLSRALSSGLPLPKWAADRYGTAWNQCPFIPENGYGEISVNLPCHTTHQPPAITAADVIATH